MSTITIEGSNIKIPLEATEKGGWVVITFSPNAYVILPAEKVKDYPTEKISELARALRGLAPESERPSYYHPSKIRALKRLRELGITNVSGGEEYFSHLVTDPPSLEQVRQGLASIKGSLSDEVIAQREER